MRVSSDGGVRRWRVMGRSKRRGEREGHGEE